MVLARPLPHPPLSGRATKNITFLRLPLGSAPSHQAGTTVSPCSLFSVVLRNVERILTFPARIFSNSQLFANFLPVECLAASSEHVCGSGSTRVRIQPLKVKPGPAVRHIRIRSSEEETRVRHNFVLMRFILLSNRSGSKIYIYRVNFKKVGLAAFWPILVIFFSTRHGYQYY